MGAKYKLVMAFDIQDDKGNSVVKDSFVNGFVSDIDEINIPEESSEKLSWDLLQIRSQLLFCHQKVTSGYVQGDDCSLEALDTVEVEKGRNVSPKFAGNKERSQIGWFHIKETCNSRIYRQQDKRREELEMGISSED